MDFNLDKAISDEVVSGIIAGRFLPEKSEVKIKPGFGTGCWAWIPPHRIYIGDAILKNPQVRKGLTEDQLNRYVGAYVRHEQGHGLFTDRDLKGCKSILEKSGIPFSLWNLFEDARMEHRYRERYKIPFGWVEFEDSQFDKKQVKELTSLATSMLFSIIQSDGLHDADTLVKLAADIGMTSVSVNNPGYPDGIRPCLSIAESVIRYYISTCQQEGLSGLLPIMKKWIEEFGMPPEGSKGGEPDGTDDSDKDEKGGERAEDLKLSLLLASNDEAREAFEADTRGYNEKICTTEGGKETGDKVDIAEAGSRDLLSDTSFDIDRNRVRVISDNLRRLFMERVRVDYSEEASKRISARHCALDRAPYRHRRVFATARRKFVLVVDCSGSMAGKVIEEGRILVSALSDLEREGKLEAQLILSVGTGSSAYWQRFKLPLMDTTISRIDAYGSAEGLEHALRSNLSVLKAADFVCVYTDGNITDTPIERRWFHSRGIYTWGLYAGTKASPELLQKYFDRPIIRPSIEGLVTAMLMLKRS